MCSAGEQLGESPRPAGAPSLPSPPAAPPGPAPTCLPRDSPAGRPAGGWLGRRVGWPAGDAATRPRTCRTRLGRRSRRGDVKEEEAAEGAGARGAVKGDPGDPSVPAALRHAGTVLPRRSLAPHGPSGSCCAGGRVLLRAPRFLCSPHPPSPLPDRGRRGSPQPPTSRAGGRDPGSACPAPDRLQRDTWRLGGPLAPRRLLTNQQLPQDTDP